MTDPNIEPLSPNRGGGMSGERVALIAIASLLVGLIAGVIIALVIDDDDSSTETGPSTAEENSTTSEASPTTTAPTSSIAPTTAPPSTQAPTTTAAAGSIEGAVAAYRATGACGGEASSSLGFVSGIVEPVPPYNPDTGGSDLTADLSPRTIVGVVCSQGLSNAGLDVTAYVDGVLQPLALPQWIPPDGDFILSSQVVGSLQIGEETGAAHLMTLYTEDRGVGGCGRFYSWAFSGQGVNPDVVKEQTCEDFDAGNGSDDPTQWPSVYEGE